MLAGRTGVSDDAIPVNEDLRHRLNQGVVLVASSSRINSLVVSKIIERTGMRSIASTPQTAWTTFSQARPAMVILDGGADDLECSDFIVSMQNSSDDDSHSRPAILFLSSHISAVDASSMAYQEVIAKPITSDVLQPALRRMSQR